MTESSVVTNKYVLPSKIKGFLQRLDFDYVRQNATYLEKIVGGAKVYVRENTDPTRFSGGGAVLHDVILFLPIKPSTKSHTTLDR